MTNPFITRNPTYEEIERFRLILSTYQDGSGMLKRKDRTLPGWRDFERSIAAAFNGEAQESKWIYDVLLTNPEDNTVRFGLSCKMRGTLREVERKKRVTIELSNASGEFWDAVKKEDITQENYHESPDTVGKILIETVERWHTNVSLGSGGTVDSTRSSFIVLQWEERSGRYQLFQYTIDLPDPTSLAWKVKGRRLIGDDAKGTLFEWYGLSGGQLKYYPLADDATWHSPVFSLEALPDNHDYGLVRKAELYFPELWRTLK
ncbi:MAG: hypothetical protein KF753_16340 [Caldilineaceae bacterium]|nr:hypothetical protein [Caldilineaceae bacterium]